jgi:hypothetical protein
MRVPFFHGPLGTSKGVLTSGSGAPALAKTTHIYFLPALETGTPRSKCGQAGPSEASLLGFSMVVFSLCSQLVFPPCVSVSIQISSSYKDTCHRGLEPTLIALL